MGIDHHRARKRFGQNFLHDPIIIKRIVDTFNPKKTERIIEIGPGKGVLTRLILQRVNQLDVIEIDRDLVTLLESEFAHVDDFKIHPVDTLKFDFSSLTEQKLRIIGNLPYNISSPLLFHLLNYSYCIQDMFFMLQKEVVDRICATQGTKQYGRLSVMLQFYCDVEMLFTVKPDAFKPTPKVDSAIIRLAPKKQRLTLFNDECLRLVVREAFSKRRKTIKNTLKNIFSEEQLINADIAPEMRAENLSVKHFVDLANQLHQLKMNTL